MWRDVTSLLHSLLFRYSLLSFVILFYGLKENEDGWKIKNKMDRAKKERGWWWKRNKIERLKKSREEERTDKRWFSKERGERMDEDESCADGWLLSSLHFLSSFHWIHLLSTLSFLLFFFPRFKYSSWEWGLSLCTEWINNTEPTLVISGQVFLLQVYSFLLSLSSILKPSSCYERESRGHPSLTKIYPVLSFRFGPSYLPLFTTFFPFITFSLPSSLPFPLYLSPTTSYVI